MAEQTQLASAQDATPQAVMMQLIAGFWVSRALYIAAKLGIADLVKDHPRSVEELAEATDTHADSLYRLLRALASVGLFAEAGEKRFGLTPLAATLISDAPGTLRYFAISELGSEHYAGWSNLLHSIKTGEIAFNHHYGKSVWHYFAEHPEDAAIFNQSMTGLTEMTNAAVAAAYDFSSFSKVIDIGGGQGGLLTSILKCHPAIQGVLFDLPHTMESANERLHSEGMAERCEVVSGDFFASVTEGGDAYLLKFILHDWNDEQCVTILKNCRRAIQPNGKLIVIEQLITDGEQAPFTKWIDLNMLVMAGGRERTEAEYRALYEAAGFKLTRIVPTESFFVILEGAPA